MDASHAHGEPAHPMDAASVREALTQVIASDAVAEWLQEPNDAFDGLKPIEVIERGESDRIWRMMFYLESGVPH